MVSSLRTDLENTRLSNIYSIDKRTYLFKFTKATGKFNLLIESGQRLHFVRGAEKLPTAGNFVVKLKKHLKGKRFAGITQLAAERLIRIDFTYKALKEGQTGKGKGKDFKGDYLF